MPKATKIEDTTVGICDIGLPCCSHSRAGINTSGSPDVIINDTPSHRLDDTGDCRCPHGGTYKSVEGSPDVIVNDKKQTRVSDLTICQACGMSGNHVTGSSNVIIN